MCVCVYIYLYWNSVYIIDDYDNDTSWQGVSVWRSEWRWRMPSSPSPLHWQFDHRQHLVLRAETETDPWNHVEKTHSVSLSHINIHTYIRIYIFIYLTLYLSLPIFLPLWQMLCVVGCMPHADWTPSALLELHATCATHSNSNPHLPAHTHTHTICTWVSGRECWGRKTHRDLTVLLLGQWPI